jgi:hypothetical protein
MRDACQLMALAVSMHDNHQKRSQLPDELRSSTTTTTITNVLSEKYLAIKVAEIVVFPHDAVAL